MRTTRSSARQSPADLASLPSKTAAGQKRKPKSPSAGTETSKKQQKTIEESVPDAEKRHNGAAESTQPKEEANGNHEEKTKENDEKVVEHDAEHKHMNGHGSASHPSTDRSVPPKDLTRSDHVSTNVLEKGLIYFFFRGRVGIEEPHGVADIARSYIVLRPLPRSAKIGDGPIEDHGRNRLLALPKKVLPQSHGDRFMAFVEKGQATVQDLKEDFIAGSEYATQTSGIRHSPGATPAGEGVYAITSTGNTSHLAYILTRPSELNEVQQALGLRARGSFVTSVKNPTAGGPPNTNLPQGAKFSEDIMTKFHGRGWMPLEAKILDYDNAQMILIGEGFGDMGKAVAGNAEDEKPAHETPLEEMEKLEGEDEIPDDPVFADLDLTSQDHKKLQTTW
ncbi:MAG: hypothetical protein M1838_005006 [Thelocarpon superellum]|nr:MAG: hypothetical protein M1838_005006 [Thelocarpon superellum]